MRPHNIYVFVAIIGLGAGVIQSQDDSHPQREAIVSSNHLVMSDGLEKINFSISGYANFQTFHLARYTYKGGTYRDQQHNNVVANLTFNVELSPRFSTHIGFESYVWFNNMPPSAIRSGQARLLEPIWSFYLHQAENVLLVGSDSKWLKGKFSIGYFPFKYNDDATNLGEYLFRSGTYPGWLIATFDVPWTRLTGMKFSGTLFDRWDNDVLLTTEMEKYPLYDISLTWLSSVKFLKCMDIQAGYQFARMIPFKFRETTPDVISSSVDNSYIDDSGDTAFYTFQGHKIMARCSFDPKKLFRSPLSFLGKDDGKIFCEAAILGLQNQGKLYNALHQRIPVMFGINVPMFKMLDVASLQFEYYGTPYPNNYDYQLLPYWQGVPQPTQVPIDGVYNVYARDNWKWSVYVKRTIGKHFALIGQAARDHWRTSSGIGFYVHDSGESMVDQQDWYWALKAVSFF